MYNGETVSFIWHPMHGICNAHAVNRIYALSRRNVGVVVQGKWCLLALETYDARHQEPADKDIGDTMKR